MTPHWTQLRQSLDETMIRDRHRLRRQLADLEKRSAAGKDVAGGLDKWQQARDSSVLRAQRRREQVPAHIEYPPQLPISDKREDIARLISEHQVVVLAGETGSGKTTQVPKICLELGRGITGTIGHTQPRRIAARTVAARVAEELDTSLGDRVGYQVRFTEQSSEHSLIKVMTDGILLAEIQRDPWLNQYDTLIVDEAHERSLNIDFLLGYLKQLLPKRPDLKLIITSATIDLERFSRHFDNAPIIEVSGRTYPVDVWYRPPAPEQDDPVQTIIEAVAEIEDFEKRQGSSAGTQRGGDILVFLSGERDIRETAQGLRKAGFPHLEILPFYARLSMAEQQKVFAPHRGRRVVLATNVAETSITVPGIRYVIDPGFARLSRYSYRTKVQRLPVEPISQASANQRKGRCGRTSEGICIRLYSEEDFRSRPAYTDAEILRTNLAAVILQMLHQRMGDIHRFPFIDPPDSRLIKDGFKLLEELHAVDGSNRLTTLGRELSQLSVDPQLARMLLAARDLNCVRELLIIVSGLAVQDPRERPADRQQAADQQHRRFRHEQSDFIGYVNLWHYLEEQRLALSQNQLRKLCKKEFISYLRWREWRDLHHQLRVAGKVMGLRENSEPADYAAVHRALLTGLLGNVGCHHEDREYLGARNRKFAIFPGSSQAKKRPKWLVAGELLETSRLFAHTVAKVEPEWILEAAEHLVKREHFEPHYDARSGQVLAYEKISLYGLVLVAKRQVSYGRIDPDTSREVFIRAALVEGRYWPERRRGEPPAFFRHNRALVAELDALEAKSRRRDILADEQVIVDFYSERLPPQCHNRAAFEQWRKQAERDNPQLLFLSRDILMRHGAGDVTEAQFPDRLHWRGMELPLRYQFAPGGDDDGVTLEVPVSLLHQVPAQRLEWLVPGMLRDKCIALVKSLPKQWRRHFVPVPDWVDKALAGLKPDNVPLTDMLAHQLQRHSALAIPADAWNTDKLDDFYRMNIRVLDDNGKVMDSSRDLELLRQRYREEVQENIQSAADSIERTGITTWDFGNLSQTVQLQRAGIVIRAYPALVDQGQSVALQVLDDPDRARALTRRGVVRLLFLSLGQTVKYLQKELLKQHQLGLSVADMGGREAVADDLIMAALAQCCLLPDGSLPADQAAFEQCLAQGRAELVPCTQALEDILIKSLNLLVAIRKTLKQHKSQLPLAFTLSDIQQQLQQLFAPQVIFDTPPRWFQQYPRYLRALQLRLEKAPLDARRDRLLLAEPQAHWQRLADYLAAEGEYRLALNPELQDYRWWIEELRVSLFAQSLKTLVPISGKRLDRQWQQALGFPEQR